MRTRMICLSISTFLTNLVIWLILGPKEKKGDCVCNGVVIFVNMVFKSFKEKIVIYIFF